MTETIQNTMTKQPGATPGRAVLTVLHVGCGLYHPEKLHPEFRGPEWREVRVDADPGVGPDIVASITDLSMIASGSVHAVWSSHNLEHVYAHEVPLALSEFYRVLRPEGIALITLPDLQKVAELVAADRLTAPAYQSAVGPITALDILFGHGASVAEGRTLMAHKTGFTATSLGDALLRAGFARVDVNRSGFDLWAMAEKTATPRYA
jgi:hypothetical protein